MEFVDVIKISLLFYFLIMLAITLLGKKISKVENVRERLSIYFNNQKNV